MTISAVQENASTTEEILDGLLSLIRAGKAFPCCCLQATQTWQVNQFEVEGATLAFPLRGHFRCREAGEAFYASPGEMLVLPNARSIAIECEPDGDSGEFVALSVLFAEEQLEAARLLLGVLPPADPGKMVSEPIGQFIAPLSRWSDALRAGHRTLALHAMLEVLLMLYEMGHHSLLRIQPPGIAMTIRKMVSRDPAHHWCTGEIEERLNISGATLRRRLAAENTTLSAVITDARIADALQLLMTTRIPIKSIAARVGYTSVASFSRQFSKRYGAEPSVFRQTAIAI
ncbi:helix-turn-helix transcriptional regulator [Kosakonia sp.]|uniref:helix-turn-helix transcriptional regulator n=1 Tax=Kosakonia sp. TaxID=1916651 RepID=UPI0028A041E3|nr:helix-turn-helix transcriptional regulator [Kosakonia sp.]